MFVYMAVQSVCLGVALLWTGPVVPTSFPMTTGDMTLGMDGCFFSISMHNEETNICIS